MKRRHAGSIVALVALLTLPAMTAAAAGSLFFDDFERANQPLASGDWDPLGGTPPRIDDGRACGDVQSATVYTRKLAGKHVRVSYSFSAAAVEGLETYVVMPTSRRTYIVGCDGGGAVCTPTIRSSGPGGKDDGGPQTRGLAVSLSANTKYRLAAEIDDGLVTLRLADSDGKVLAELGLSANENFDQYGLVVGRNADGQLTCVDDFRIEDLSL